MNIQTLTEESRSHKLEFINLYCKHVAKFTKMFGLNRYKAHKFEMIHGLMQTHSQKYSIRGAGGYLKGLEPEC